MDNIKILNGEPLTPEEIDKIEDEMLEFDLVYA